MFGIKKLRVQVSQNAVNINEQFALVKSIEEHIDIKIEAMEHKMSMLDNAVHSPLEKIDNYLAIKFEKLEELIDAVHMNLIRELLRRDMASEKYIDAHLMKYKGYEIKKIVKEVFLEKPNTLTFQDIKNRLFKDILKEINTEIDMKVESIIPEGGKIPKKENEEKNPAHFCMGLRVAGQIQDIIDGGNKDEGRNIHGTTSQSIVGSGTTQSSEDKGQAEPKTE